MRKAGLGRIERIDQCVASAGVVRYGPLDHGGNLIVVDGSRAARRASSSRPSSDPLRSVAATANRMLVQAKLGRPDRLAG